MTFKSCLWIVSQGDKIKFEILFQYTLQLSIFCENLNDIDQVFPSYGQICKWHFTKLLVLEMTFLTGMIRVKPVSFKIKCASVKTEREGQFSDILGSNVSFNMFTTACQKKCHLQNLSPVWALLPYLCCWLLFDSNLVPHIFWNDAQVILTCILLIFATFDMKWSVPSRYYVYQFRGGSPGNWEIRVNWASFRTVFKSKPFRTISTYYRVTLADMHGYVETNSGDDI